MRAEVVIDARAAARPELGGVERWARELERRLPELRPGAYASARPPKRLTHAAGHAWEQTVLPLRARRARLLLCPANLAPLAFPRTVLVLHDAAALRNPGWYSPAYVAWQRGLIPRLARRAVHVITVSEFSRSEIAELTGATRISVVPGGVDERFTPDADPEPARRACGLDGTRPYVLTVGSLSARKNLGALSAPAAALAQDGVDVVFAGGTRPQFATDESIPGLRALGAVPDDLLPGLYAGAAAFVLPSHYEGFGLPVLEAMAAGTPVVAADNTALPEVTGGAAILVDPDDPTALTEAIRQALNAPESTIAQGRERAAERTWASTAKQVDQLLRRLAGDSSG